MDTIKLKHLPDDSYVTDPFITKDEWLTVLRSAEKEGKRSQVDSLLRFFRMPANKGTCKAVAKEYGTDFESERSLITNFGMFTQKALGDRFRVESSDSDKDTYWPISMLGKNLGKKGFEWAVRSELVEALREYLLDDLMREYRERILEGGLDNKYSKELYKWQKLAACKGKSDLEVLQSMIEMNLISWRAAASLRKMLEVEPEETVRVFSIMKDSDRSFADKFKEYKAETRKLAVNGIPNTIDNDRTAALFLACLDPVKNSLFKYDTYKVFCNYMGFSVVGGNGTFQHYLQLIQPIIEREKADEELTAKLHSETDAYFWSDLLNAQDVLWQMQYYMDNQSKTKMAEQFTWIPFYKELAQKLLAYKDNRQGLLDFIYGGIPEEFRKYFHDLNHERNTDVDPYTVFAIFNRGIKKEARIKVCALFKDKFSIGSALPKDFMGIPIWQSRKSQLFHFRNERGEKDIDNLWALFEAEMNGEGWETPFDTVRLQAGAGAMMVTSGMFWTRPDDFLPLDQHTVKYVKGYGVEVPIKDGRIEAASYASVCTQVKQLMETGVIPEKTFAELSHVAGGYDMETDDNIDEMQPSFYDEIVSTLKGKKSIILQGAPGTGKTYAIPEVVTRLCGEAIDYTDRQQVMKAFSRLVSEKRVVFTTFHQSMDYEDFVEGLKPFVDENKNVYYDVVDGIFKSICKDAAKPVIRNNSIDLNPDAVIWKVSLKGTYENEVRTECLKNGHIRIGWDEYGENYEEQSEFENGGRVVLDAFYNKMSEGDVVLSCYTNKLIDAIGVVEGEPEWNEEYPWYRRVRKVRWLVKDIREDVSILMGKNMTLSTIYKLNDISIEDVLELLKKHSAAGTATSEKNTKPYVIVIDEINRGNVSKIFGELITLLEADKRADGAMPLTARLPYSKTDLSVPSNLYLIGTMNTADRSLSQFDYAMRRRFRFITMSYNLVEMKPAPGKVFQEELFEKVTKLFISNLDKYKDDPNVRLVPADCFSREFKPVDLWIGPSYFITDENDPDSLLNNIFYEIIPTLEHYLEDGVFVDETPVNTVIEELKEIALNA